MPRSGAPATAAELSSPTRAGSARRIVLNTNKRGPAPFNKLSYARRAVREARRAANIPEYLTLDACRPGGPTCYGDAGASAIELRARSAHGTISSPERYVKRIEAQQLGAARKGRARLSATNSGRVCVGMRRLAACRNGPFTPSLFRAAEAVNRLGLLAFK
jgi:hypothetical protein